jgi:hypothetical protein
MIGESLHRKGVGRYSHNWRAALILALIAESPGGISGVGAAESFCHLDQMRRSRLDVLGIGHHITVASCKCSQQVKCHVAGFDARDVELRV